MPDKDDLPRKDRPRLSDRPHPDLKGTAYYHPPAELDEKERARILADLTQLQAQLTEQVQALLPPALDPGPVPDGQRRQPSRAELFLPFLLIRSWAGDPYDHGQRPTSAVIGPEAYNESPDIVVTQPMDVNVLSPVEFNERAQRAEPYAISVDAQYDVWVHVWNLGQFPAYGVRVRAWAWWELGSHPGLIDPSLEAPGYNPARRPTFLGGLALDLGDRTAENSHMMVRAGRWSPDGTHRYQALLAVAESFADPVGSDAGFTPDTDRHVAMRSVALINPGM